METKQNFNDEIEIDLREVLILLISKAWLICLVGVLTALIGFVLSAFVILRRASSVTVIISVAVTGAVIPAAEAATSFTIVLCEVSGAKAFVVAS